MAFHFSLEALLRFRQSLERREESLLQIANHKVAELCAQIEILEQVLADRTTARRGELRTGAFAVELQFDLMGEAALAERTRILKEDLALLEAARNQQMESFCKARAQREILEAIRDRQIILYDAKQQRRAQRDLDDLFLMRREFVRRG